MQIPIAAEPAAAEQPAREKAGDPAPELSDEQFVERIERRVLDTIERFDLFTRQDKVLVAMSGGKDSTMLGHILRKHGFEIEAVTVDAHIGCYTEENLRNLRQVCAKDDIPLHEIPFRKVFGGSLCHIRDTINRSGTPLKSCTVCGVLRRWLINRKAQELDPACIAFGHNLDDEAQAFLMNVVKNNLAVAARMGPTTGRSEDKKLVPRVKPLYFVSEQEVVRYVRAKRFPVHVGKCPCSVGGQRDFFKDLLNEREKQAGDAGGKRAGDAGAEAAGTEDAGAGEAGVKRALIEYFLEKKPLLQDRFAGGSTRACGSCGEPASGERCRTCQLLDRYYEASREAAGQASASRPERVGAEGG